MRDEKKCPFCRSDRLKVRKMHVVVFVECLDCDAGGPSCDTESEALGAWNRRDPWASIETAPKDGTLVDLIVDGDRWTDCVWGLPSHCCGEAGQYCDSDWHSLKPGWVWTSMNEMLYGEPTHFMIPPKGPPHA